MRGFRHSRILQRNLFRRIVLATFAKNIRQDHFYIQRKTNERHEVIGVDVSGSKIGGDQENACSLPDPMGLQVHSHMRLETISKQLKASLRVMRHALDCHARIY